jgi:D-serine deaminase-like pyridoxal phosphate-dependent protein
VFLDIDPGMNRTGIEQNDSAHVIRLISAMRDAGLPFRGLHYYDGQYGHVAEPQRMAATHAGYDRLLQLATEVQSRGFPVPEIVTAGTPTFPCSLSYKRFLAKDFVHRVSPGTIVYCDATSLAQLPREYGYRPAALVVARVVSNPLETVVTCDAGHKAVSADAGVPTCVVVGHPELTPLSPSEEHLPLRKKEQQGPRVGEVVYLLPRHICPTVNNFDCALLVKGGKIAAVEQVSARGHEAPLLRGSHATQSNRVPAAAQKN